MPHAHKFASVRCERWLASDPTSRDDTRTHMHRNACRSRTRCALRLYWNLKNVTEMLYGVAMG
eukprot:5956763-Prymnesium_polylepis.1